MAALTGAARIALADLPAAQDAPQFGTRCQIGSAIAISFPEVLRSIFGAQATTGLIGFTMAPRAHIRVLDLTVDLGIDIDGVTAEKMAKNRERPYKHGARV